MLKINNLVRLLMLITLTGQLYAQGINFEHGTWEEVVAKAKKENKPIFVDAYTTWCGPCKWMAKKVFVQEEVGIYFNKNFIAYKMDMEKGEGPAFAKANRINVYPTLLYFDPSGEMLHKGVGARDADGLIALSNDAMDTDKQLAGFIKTYKSGKKDKEFLKSYLVALVSSGEETQQPFNELWSQLSDKEKQTEEIFELMIEASNRFRDIKSPLTIYFLDHTTTYKKETDNNNNGLVEKCLRSCYINTLWGIARLEDKKEETTMTKEVLARFPEAKKELKKRLAYIKTTMETPPDEAKIQKAYVQYLKVSNDANELNSAAWNVYEEQDDFKALKQALGWVDRAINMEANYFNLDTKAALLYKLKNYEEAKIYAEKAIKAAKEVGMAENEEEATLKLLENINAKLDKTDSTSK